MVDRAQITLGRGAQLWCIERDGDILRTAHGRRGRPAHTSVRACKSADSAEHLFNRAVATRKDRLYHRVTTPPGWPGELRPPEAIHTLLEHRLRREPLTPGLADEYAAWLTNQHDPRGELAALQDRSAPDTDATHRAARRFAWLFDPSAAALPPAWWWCAPRPLPVACHEPSDRAQAEEALLARHRRHFLGDLPDLDDRALLTILTWHRGFLDTVTLAAHANDDDDDDIPDRELLRRLLRLRSARLLRALAVELPECDGWADDGPPNHDIDLLQDALRGPPARALLSFALGSEPIYDADAPLDEFYDVDTARIAAPQLGDLRLLGLAFPRLEHLFLAGHNIDVGGWWLPRLRHAELHFARPEEAAVAAFARAAWPELRSLRLGLGNFATPAAETDAFALLGPIFTAERMPALRHLALVHVPDADAVVAAVARGPHAACLETLELSCSGMTDAGARELVQARPRLAGLKRLNVSDNLLTTDDRRLLHRAFAGVHVYTGSQRTPETIDLDDECWIEEMRLAALGGAPVHPTGVLRNDDDLPDHLDDNFELLLDHVVVAPRTEDDVPRFPRPDAGVRDPEDPTEPA
jgi:hypothetical protein